MLPNSNNKILTDWILSDSIGSQILILELQQRLNLPKVNMQEEAVSTHYQKRTQILVATST